MTSSDDFSSGTGAAKKRLEAAEGRLKRFRAAIDAGVDPSALVEAINEAQAQRAAARAELEGSSPPGSIEDAEVYAMIDSLGDARTIISRADPAKLEELFAGLGLEMVYNAEGRTVDVTIRPVGRVSARVRGGT
ncbi:hypothetical protein [Saccharothrix coeruleofusca]|uniref:hypothetical protein n=1 Tax=Saccharothrix coeruleofusca TaxID=33919 RepID=UPI001AE7A925|nr:hypothetical protein [Saccharothrix coeruleofusca]